MGARGRYTSRIDCRVSTQTSLKRHGMDRITLEDFRCFHARQSARLAPLTLLVGENSTGKTSFMALVRALWEVAFRDAIPDFKGEPYDLGSFAEVAHHRGGRGGRADTFEAGFHVAESERLGVRPFSFDVKFGRRGTAPVPVWRRVYNPAASMTIGADERHAER